MNGGPPPAVLAAFGAPDTRPERLAGGEETSVRCGDLVLKQVQGIEVAVWTQGLAAAATALQPPGPRLAEPVPTTAGAWAADGWIANRFLDGLRPLAAEPERIVAAGEQLSAALTAAAPDDLGPVLGRTDRWAVADRFVWGDEAVALTPEAEELAGRFRNLLTERTEPAVIVHGDLAGNVFADRADRAVVLDLSLYVRPVRYGSAIVVADNLLWRGGDPALFGLVDHDVDALARALLFRLVAEQLGSNPRHGANLDDYRRVAAALGWF